MGKLVQQTLADLRDIAALESGANDGLWLAGDLMHRYHSQFRWPSAFEFIDAEPISPAEAQELARAVRRAIEECTSAAAKGSLLWALSFTRDPQFKPLYIEHIKAVLSAIEGGNLIIQSCLGALNDLGEDVSDDLDWKGTYQIEENWHQARSAIARLYPSSLFPYPFGLEVPKDIGVTQLENSEREREPFLLFFVSRSSVKISNCVTPKIIKQSAAPATSYGAFRRRTWLVSAVFKTPKSRTQVAARRDKTVYTGSNLSML